MNYQIIYDRIISKADGRVLPLIYMEKHHIIPKCIGGTNYKNNLAYLTPEEHYVAHQLLMKIYPDEYKLKLAVLRMSGKGNKHRRCNNKLFGWLRRKIFEERTFTLETRLKMSEAAKNQSEKKKADISKKLKGRVSPNKGNVYTEEQCARIKKSKEGKYIAPNLGKRLADSTKQKMSDAKKGIPKTAEHKEKMKIAQQNRRLKESQ